MQFIWIVALVATASWSQTVHHMAYFEPSGGGCVFLGSFEHSAFVRAVELSTENLDNNITAADRILHLLPLGKPLSGINSKGRPVTVVVDDHNAMPGDGQRALTGHPVSGDLQSGAFVSKPYLPVRILRSQPAKLDSGVNAKLVAEAERLWRKHATELAPGSKLSGFEASQLRVEHVAQFPELLAVLYRVKFRGEDSGQSWTDDSATVFFLYSLAQQRILIGTFGHGEWAPGSSVLTVKPVFYFRVGDAKAVYMLAERYGGWEEWGHAIFDLRTGRELLQCY